MGTMITHCDSPGGGSGIFDGSKVLMYEFERNQSIKGVIINKSISGINVGGPVGLRRPVESSDKIILHNIPDVEGSTRVIEGVYWHDGARSQLAQYENDERWKINEYYGFASWFEG